MAGPGAQIFVDGFRGGRLPPKDQIQQVRFRTNSYAAEYHDAGMVRVEVITKPGMGNWRSRANFGFRDESMNGTNAFADEQAPEQVKRWQVNSQGPIVKGKTSVSFSVEGNDSYDSQTIVATVPEGEVRGQVRRPNDVVNATIRARAGARRRQLAARRVPAAHPGPPQPRRRRLRSARARLQHRRRHRHAAAAQHPRASARPCSRELKFEFVQTGSENTSFSTDPTVRVLDSFTRGGAGQSGVRDGRQFVVDGSFDFTLRKHALRTGLLFEAGQWDSTQQTNANGTYTFSSLDDVRGRAGPAVQPAVRRSAGQLLAVPGRLVRPGRLQAEQEPAGEPGTAPGGADPRRRQLEPGAARRLHLDGGQDQRPRRVGPVLRLVRQRHLRADAAARRHPPDRRVRPQPDLSALGRPGPARCCRRASSGWPTSSTSRSCSRRRSASTRT